MIITVQPKDTLYSISRRYGVSVDVIKNTNKLNSENLFIGQQLRIDLPTPTTPPAPITPSQPPTPTTTGGTLSNFQVQTIKQNGYNQYIITYPTPNGAEQSNTMRDNYPSPNLANPKGVMYMGKKTFDSCRDSFIDLCQQPFYANVLKHISKTEGCFDAVNSYDKALFSFGFIQFTGAAASGSILSRVLLRFKVRDQYAFTDTFGKYGIDIQNGNPSPILILKTATGTLQGDDAYRAIANDLRLTGVFIASASRRSAVRAQIEIALENYVYPALGEKAAITFAGTTVALNQVLHSEAGFALRVDLCVNRGLTGSMQVIQKAITQVAQEQGISSVAGLARIDELRVVEVIAQNDGTATPKGQRTLAIRDSGNFSFDKA